MVFPSRRQCCGNINVCFLHSLLRPFLLRIRFSFSPRSLSLLIFLLSLRNINRLVPLSSRVSLSSRAGIYENLRVQLNDKNPIWSAADHPVRRTMVLVCAKVGYGVRCCRAWSCPSTSHQNVSKSRGCLDDGVKQVGPCFYALFVLGMVKDICAEETCTHILVENLKKSCLVWNRSSEGKERR